MMVTAFCLSVCLSAQAMVTINDVETYFTKTQSQPSNFIYEVFWLGAGVELGNTFAEEYAIKDNRPLEGGITPLQIAARIGSKPWLTFLLESNQPPFTEIVALREKILNAGNAETELEFTEADRRHINQPLNENGDTAIILAARAGQHCLVDQLIRLGAYPKQVNIAGESAQQLDENKQ